MAGKCKGQGIAFRPHFKTHQSAPIGNWFREEGIDRITVSSLKMAEYFAGCGWNDIFIAFPVNILEVDGLNRLGARIALSISIESDESARFMAKHLAVSTGVYLKIDTGYHRTGIDPEDHHSIDSILQVIDGSAKMTFKGFYTHAGHTYHAGGRSEISGIARSSIQQLIALKEKYLASFPGLFLSYGDTPSCSILDDFSGLDEIRPGNFIFYDLMQHHLDVCTLHDIGVALECPVVAKNKARKEILVHGGAVHLSKEYLSVHGEPCYGLVVPMQGSDWGMPMKNTRVSALSQEHGIIRTDEDTFGSFHIGETVGILPVHSCLTANLAEHYITTDGRLLGKMRS